MLNEKNGFTCNEKLLNRSASAGLGCWVFGDSSLSEYEVENTIQSALQKGITHFDTAQSYGDGRSERLLGKAVSSCREKLFIASKMMFTPGCDVLSSVCRSCKRLGTEYIDTMYIHWPQRGADLCEMMEGLEEARNEGLIRFIGVSNFSVRQMKDVMQAGTIDAYQFCYNLLWRWGEMDCIPFCQKNKIALVTYGSIAQGILTGKYSEERPVFGQGLHQKCTIFFEPMVWPLIFDCVEEMKIVSDTTPVSLVQLALLWVMRNPAITSVLFGARSPEQLNQIFPLQMFDDQDVFNKLTVLSDRLMRNIPNTGTIFNWNP